MPLDLIHSFLTSEFEENYD